ncbi:hypothetical protein AAHC03_0331 [Spirometra sp. Aus1]
MGKEKPGFLTPKAIANRIKSKGLQKLRWYCQMCQKQCRDENGYKCHTASEAHHRQMKIFMENGGKFISSFSSEFLKGYLDIVRRQFGGKRVHANVVYQEYIKDKQHIHMNATRWHSLTGLCLWLGKQGICRVDETEKGWYIEYIDRDPEKEQRKASEARLEKTEDDINRQFLQKQIESMKEKKENREHSEERRVVQPLKRSEDEDHKIRLDICLAPKRAKKEEQPGEAVASSSSSDSASASSHATEKSPPPVSSAKPPIPKPQNPLLLAEKKAKMKAEAQQQDSHSSSAQRSSAAASSTSTKAPAGPARRNVLDEILAEEERAKERMNRKAYWLTTGIVVKLINRKLPQELLYRRAVVLDMEDNYTAVVRVVNGTTKLKVDQEHVQTVIPPLGDYVLVVNGAYRSEVAIVKAIDKDRNVVDICIDSGLCRGRLVRDVSMDDVCKINDEEST